jgi:hypothetical protein
LADRFIDVAVVVPVAEIDTASDPSQFLFEKMRVSATILCEEQGLGLRTDRAPEILFQQAQRRLPGDLGGEDCPVCGEEFLLLASRWAVTTS